MEELTQVEKYNAKRRAAYALDAERRTNNYARKKKWVRNNKELWAKACAERYEKEPFLRLIEKSKHRSRIAGTENDLTTEWARARWTGRCEITNALFKKPKNGKQNGYSPSLDKIDPALGYVQSNCRFILCALNRFKGDESDETMMEIAKLLIEKEHAKI